MIFKLTTSGHFYSDKPERDKLEKLGFSFKPSDYKSFSIDGNPTIEINTMEELLKFIEEYGCIVIWVSEPRIEIYDDYRE